jgi:hypothetical protein
MATQGLKRHLKDLEKAILVNMPFKGIPLPWASLKERKREREKERKTERE